MSPMLNRIPRQSHGIADWLLLAVIVILPCIVAFGGLEWACQP